MTDDPKILAESRKSLLAFYRARKPLAKPEAMFKELIDGGFLKVLRRKGKPPALIWLQ